MDDDPDTLTTEIERLRDQVGDATAGLDAAQHQMESDRRATVTAEAEPGAMSLCDMPDCCSGDCSCECQCKRCKPDPSTRLRERIAEMHVIACDERNSDVLALRLHEALDALEESEARAQRLIEAGEALRNYTNPNWGSALSDASYRTARREAVDAWTRAKLNRVAERLEGRDG